MKLERLHEYVVIVMALLGGLAFAVLCGHLIGEGKTGLLLLMLYGIFLTAVLLVLKEKIWVLIPMAWALEGQVPELPLPFAVRDLVVLSVFGCFLLLKAFKIVRHKPKAEVHDVLMVVILLYLASAFIRNPVGTDAFDLMGSGRVGGKPYFNALIAALAYWVLARVVISEKSALRLPLLMLVGPLLEGALSAITFYFPSTAPVLTRFYSTLSSETYNAQDLRLGPNVETPNRLIFLKQPGWFLVRALCAIYRPMTLINPLYIFRCGFYLTGMGFVLLSGFRGYLMMTGVVFLLCSYFRHGMREVVRLIVIAFPLLCLLLIMQGRLFELPYAAQRALSFLPGKWDPAAVGEAKASTEWRVMMWNESLFTDKYIENKILGDGYGFTKRQLTVMKANELYGTVEDGQENLLISGGVHSGPVSAIRFVGVVGLVLFTVLMILMARESWRLIIRSKNSAFLPACLFIGVPVLCEPLYYYVIFGGFEGALPAAVFNLGMLKMLKNSLDARDARLSRETADQALTAGTGLAPVRAELPPSPLAGVATGGPRRGFSRPS